MTQYTFKEFLIQEAKDAKGPATRDIVKGIMREPSETDESRPSTKRSGQRAVRTLRRRYGLKHPQGAQFNESDEGFNEYMKQVDAILSSKFGFGYMDLPDYMWMDMYEDEVDPETAVEDFIEWAGLDMF